MYRSFGGKLKSSHASNMSEAMALARLARLAYSCVLWNSCCTTNKDERSRLFRYKKCTIHVTSSTSRRCTADCTAESKPARCNSSEISLWTDLDVTASVIDGSGGSGRDTSEIGAGLRCCGC